MLPRCACILPLTARFFSRLVAVRHIVQQIDAHNIVPVWVASDKQEVGARTIRKKITDKLGRYLTEFPPMPSNPSGTVLPKAVDWDEALASVEIDRTVLEVAAIKPGADAAHATLKDFITTRLNVCVCACLRDSSNRESSSCIASRATARSAVVKVVLVPCAFLCHVF